MSLTSGILLAILTILLIGFVIVSLFAFVITGMIQDAEIANITYFDMSNSTTKKNRPVCANCKHLKQGQYSSLCNLTDKHVWWQGWCENHEYITHEKKA